MSVTISEVTNSQSFGVLVQRVNQVTDIISTNTVTTGSLPGGAVTTGNAFVNGMLGSNTIYTTYLAGGNISSNTILTIVSNTFVNNYLTVGNSTINASFGYVNATQSIGSFYASVNSYLQTTTSNENTGPSASGDWVAYNDDTSLNTFIDMGINSSEWSNTQWTIGGPNDAYLYTGNNSNLNIGTNNNGSYVSFFTSGTLVANERMRIDGSGNVGIGTTSPDAMLAVNGTVNVISNVSIGGYTSIRNTISVTGVNSDFIPVLSNTYNLGNSTHKWQSLYVSGNTIYVDTVAISASGNNLIVPGLIDQGAASVNGAITGSNTIAITGNATFSNQMTVTGNVALSNTLAVTGATTLSNTLAVTGNVTLSNSISVTGNAYLLSSVGISGSLTVANNFSVTNTAAISNTLTVTGSITGSNTFVLIGNASLSNTLTVNGAITTNSSLSVASNTTLSNTLAVTGNVTLSNTLAVTGATTLSNTLLVNGVTTVNNTLTVNGNVTHVGTTLANGAVTINSTLSTNGSATFSNSVAITGATTVNNSLTVNGAVTVTNSNISLNSNSGAYISVGNGSVNATVNSSTVSVINVNATYVTGTLTTANQPNITANNATNLGGQPNTYYIGLSTAAYTNSVAYTDSKSSASLSQAYAYADAQSGIAFANAVNFANGVANNAYTNAVAYSSNATNLTTGTVPSGRISGNYTGITNVGTLGVLSVSNTLSVVNSISTNTLNIALTSNLYGNVVIGGNLSLTSTTGTITAQTASLGNSFPTANGGLLGNSTLRWATSATTLDVSANASIANLTVSNTATINNLSTTNVSAGIITTTANVFIGQSGNVVGDFRIGGNLYVTGSTISASTTSGDIIPNGNTFNLGNTSNRFTVWAISENISNNLVVSNTVTVGNTLSTNGAVTVNGNISTTAQLVVNSISQIYSTKYSVTGTSLQTVDTFPTASFRAAEYLIQLTDTNTLYYQATKIMVLHDGTNPYITEYAQLNTNGLLGLFTSDINSGNVRLRVTPSTGNVAITLTRTVLAV
jgi:hypothetical protein